MAVMENSMAMSWWPWSILKRSQDANYLNNFAKLSKQQASGSPLLFSMEYAGRTHQKLPERRLVKWISLPKCRYYQKKQKAAICMLYQNFLNKNQLFGYYWRKLLVFL